MVPEPFWTPKLSSIVRVGQLSRPPRSELSSCGACPGQRLPRIQGSLLGRVVVHLWRLQCRSFILRKEIRGWKQALDAPLLHFKVGAVESRSPGTRRFEGLSCLRRPARKAWSLRTAEAEDLTKKPTQTATGFFSNPLKRPRQMRDLAVMGLGIRATRGYEAGSLSQLSIQRNVLHSAPKKSCVTQQGVLAS